MSTAMTTSADNNPNTGNPMEKLEYCQIHPYSIHRRLGRMRYISHLLLFNLVILTAAIIGISLGVAGIVAGGIVVGVAVYLVALTGVMITNIQRLHDADQSGWWLLLLFIPLANAALICYLLFAKGTEGKNCYSHPALPHPTKHGI